MFARVEWRNSGHKKGEFFTVHFDKMEWKTGFKGEFGDTGWHMVIGFETTRDLVTEYHHSAVETFSLISDSY